MRFLKYHALGNDYLVLDPAQGCAAPEPKAIQRICHRNFGLGSDGILFGPLAAQAEGSLGRLRIFNPDGGEAEKSGNGLRIFARYLFDTGQVTHEPFGLETAGGRVECLVRRPDDISVQMGEVSFSSERIPVAGEPREVINETLDLRGRSFTFCAATIGNPHCVIPVEKADASLARQYGPTIETDPRFPNRTNVQFLQVIDRRTIAIEIWERGAGYTLASGSSSSAAAAVARRLGLVEPDVTVRMPGGDLRIQISDTFGITMTGPATRVGVMEFDSEALGC